ncbi:uncharacterized protein HaLaN_20147, partial [Haematococcus lacustris]
MSQRLSLSLMPPVPLAQLPSMNATTMGSRRPLMVRACNRCLAEKLHAVTTRSTRLVNLPVHVTASRTSSSAQPLDNSQQNAGVQSAHPDGFVATASDSSSSSSAEDQADVSQSQQTVTVNDDSLPVRAALAGLQFYRTAISPLMPSSCRFQPTCSFYSIDSYKRYGAIHGGLTLRLTSGVANMTAMAGIAGSVGLGA